MIKRHLKLFIILLVASLLINGLGLLFGCLFENSTFVYAFGAVYLVAILIFNSGYNSYVSKRRRKGNIDKNTYLLLKETKSVIWMGIYLHIFLFVAAFIIFVQIF